MMEDIMGREGIDRELKIPDEGSLEADSENKCESEGNQGGFLILGFLESFQGSKLAL